MRTRSRRAAERADRATSSRVGRRRRAPAADGDRRCVARATRREPVTRNLGLVGVLLAARASSARSPARQLPDRATTSRNILVEQASAIGVVTVGMTFVIIGGGIDLSVGALVALAVVWAPRSRPRTTAPPA